MRIFNIKKREIIGFIILPGILTCYFPILVFLTISIVIARYIFGNTKLIVNGEKRYVFIEKSTVEFETKRIKHFNYKNNDGNLTIEWINNTTKITITGKTAKFDGFAWDGCSPKFQLLDIIVGTPDGAINPKTEKPVTYYASMVHDILYQYQRFAKDGYTKKQCDLIFLDEMRKNKFRLAFIYFLSVRIFGFTYWYTRHKNIG